MPKPISRRDFIRKMRVFGWEGPIPRGRHMAMIKSGQRVPIPNPHQGDIDWSLAKRILLQADIDPKAWEDLA